MIGKILFLSAVFAYGSFILATNICNYFWQAFIVAVIVFAAVFISWYFELAILFVSILILFFVVLLILTIAKSIEKRR